MDAEAPIISYKIAPTSPSAPIVDDVDTHPMIVGGPHQDVGISSKEGNNTTKGTKGTRGKTPTLSILMHLICNNITASSITTQISNRMDISAPP